MRNCGKSKVLGVSRGLGIPLRAAEKQRRGSLLFVKSLWESA